MWIAITKQGIIHGGDIAGAIENLGSYAGAVYTSSAGEAVVVFATKAEDMASAVEAATAGKEGDWSKVENIYTSALFGELVREYGLLALANTGKHVALRANIAGLLCGLVFEFYADEIKAAVSRLFNLASQLRSDPLTLDLDGDGIETVGIDPNNPILFDHDGDGVKTGTGWINGDDGFLVLDRNGNGTIDNGGELFGDSTVIPDGFGGTRLALDGFEALAAEDTNNDGQVDSLDANFSNLRAWRDLNQDGISQGNELATLTDLGIVAINTAKTENNTPLFNGTVIADLGTYTKTDGSQGTTGQTANMADVNFPTNGFYNEFPDILPITPEAQLLPDMQGSGLARSLREAASLGNAQGNGLFNALTNFAQATTWNTQRDQLDGLLNAWAGTVDHRNMAVRAYDASRKTPAVTEVVSLPLAA